MAVGIQRGCCTTGAVGWAGPSCVSFPGLGAPREPCLRPFVPTKDARQRSEGAGSALIFSLGPRRAGRATLCPPLSLPARSHPPWASRLWTRLWCLPFCSTGSAPCTHFCAFCVLGWSLAQSRWVGAPWPGGLFV